MRRYISYAKNPYFAALPVDLRIELQHMVVDPSDSYYRLFFRPWLVQRRNGKEYREPPRFSTSDGRRAEEVAEAPAESALALYRRLVRAPAYARWHLVSEADRDAVDREVNELADVQEAVMVSVSAIEEISKTGTAEEIHLAAIRSKSVDAALPVIEERANRVIAFLDALAFSEAPVPTWLHRSGPTAAPALNTVDEALAVIERSTTTYRAHAELDGSAPKGLTS